MFTKFDHGRNQRRIDLISERLPLGVLWFEGADAIDEAVNYAKWFSYPHPAIIRVWNDSGTLAVTLELADDFSRAVNTLPPFSTLLDKFFKEHRRFPKNRKRTPHSTAQQIEALTQAYGK